MTKIEQDKERVKRKIFWIQPVPEATEEIVFSSEKAFIDAMNDDENIPSGKLEPKMVEGQTIIKIVPKKS